VQVFAEYGDIDDEATGVTLEWQVFAPSEVPFEPPTPVENPPPATSPAELQAGIEFIPSVEGVWQVKVIATDAAGAQTELVETFDVNADSPPCIDAEPPAGTLPTFEPELFATSVSDNLDPWPGGAPTEPFIKAALFTWSVKAGTGPRDIVIERAKQNSYAFDPAAYPIGTIVEIRVEVEDRIARTLTCPDADASCAVDSGSGCFQRRTWRVEAR
jgi:hypothetical protein